MASNGEGTPATLTALSVSPHNLSARTACQTRQLGRPQVVVLFFALFGFFVFSCENVSEDSIEGSFHMTLNRVEALSSSPNLLSGPALAANQPAACRSCDSSQSAQCANVSRADGVHSTDSKHRTTDFLRLTLPGPT